MATVLVIPADQKEEEFQFPGGAVVKLRKMSLSELKNLLRDYKLSLGGNKALLLERLIDFSGNPHAWNSLVAGRRRPHKGPRDATDNAKASDDKNGVKASDNKKPKKKSQVNARRDELMGERSPNEPAHVVQRSKDNRTEQQKDDVIAWAIRFVANTPDIQTPRQPISTVKTPKPVLDSRLAKIEDHLQVLLSRNQSGGVISTGTKPSIPPPPCTSLSLSTISASSIVSVPFAAISVPSIVSALSIVSGPSSSDLSSDFTPFSAAPLEDTTTNRASHLPIPLPPCSASTRSSLQIPPLGVDVMMTDATVTESTKLLVLGNGTHLKFLSSDVPDPLSISFTKDIPQLGRVWDDTRAEFSPAECTLKIKGHAIALKHWPVAYSYSHDRRWHGIKKRWDTWKWVAERYTQSTPENFWAEFYDHGRGERMKYTTIDNLLRLQRKASNQLMADQQREQLGSQFSQCFQSRGKPMVRVSAIAKRIQNTST